MEFPGDVRPYLDRLVERLTCVLDSRLIAVYVLGGLAFGEFRPGSSDVDVYAVVSSPLDEERKLAVAEQCSHRRLPCPARKLELVVITAAAARRPGDAPRWELNFNTGADDRDHVGTDPAAEPSHWFVIDLAIARQCGIALLGPRPSELIGAPELAHVQAAQSEVVEWYARHDLAGAAVTAACRAWYWVETGGFAGKHEAVRWAMGRLGPVAGGEHRP